MQEALARLRAHIPSCLLHEVRALAGDGAADELMSELSHAKKWQYFAASVSHPSGDDARGASLRTLLWDFALWQEGSRRRCQVALAPSPFVAAHPLLRHPHQLVTFDLAPVYDHGRFACLRGTTYFAFDDGRSAKCTFEIRRPNDPSPIVVRIAVLSPPASSGQRITEMAGITVLLTRGP